MAYACRKVTGEIRNRENKQSDYAQESLKVFSAVYDTLNGEVALIGENVCKLVPNHQKGGLSGG